MADVTLQPRPASPTDQPLAVAEGDYLPGFSGNWTAHLDIAGEAPRGPALKNFARKPVQGAR